MSSLGGREPRILYVSHRLFAAIIFSFRTLRLGYYDSLLIFCPDREQFRFDQEKICGYARNILAKIHVESQAPTEEDITLVNRILSVMNRNPPISVLQKSFNTLTNAARNWSRFDVWKSAISSCPPERLIEVVGNDGFKVALESFGVFHVENM